MTFGGGAQRWARPSGRWQEDYQTGIAYAKAVVPMLRLYPGTPALAWIAEAMFEAIQHREPRRMSGIESGFMRGIGDLIAGSLYATAFVGTNGPDLAADSHATILDPEPSAIDSACKLATLFTTQIQSQRRMPAAVTD